MTARTEPKASALPLQEAASGSCGAVAARQGLLASLLTGLAFLALFPPFTIADEPVHFYRAYLLSEGQAHVDLVSGRAGASLPSSLAEAADASLRGLVRDPGATFDAERWRAVWTIPLEPERRRFMEFPASGMLTFLVYVPQALGIAIGRAFSAPPVALLYLGRLANLAICSGLLAWALTILPGWRCAMVLVALSPAAISARGSVSPDALTFSLAVLAAAFVLRHAVATRRDPAPQGITPCLGTAAAFCMTKLPYVPLLLAGLPRLLDLPRGRRVGALALTLVLLGPPIAYSAWCAARIVQPLRDDIQVDREAQVRRTVSDPAHFLRAVAHTLERQGPRLIADLWGARLGWLDVHTARAVPWVLGPSFVLLLLLDGRREGGLRRLDLLALAVAISGALLAIVLSQYATWTSPEDHLVRGLQGRYFLPVMPLLAGLLGSLIPFGAPSPRLARSAVPLTWAALASADALALYAIYSRYWID